MNIFPVFARDLRGAMANRALRKQRVVGGFCAALGFSVLLIVDFLSPGFKLNRFTLFWPLINMLPFCLLIIGLSRGGNVLSTERREGTLPLLLLTRLSGCDIILGKLFQTLVTELTGWLVIVPMLVLPLIGAGLNLSEILLLILASLNLLFYALALGLLASVFFDGRVAASWCLLLLLPFVVYSTPFSLLMPGPVLGWIAWFQWLNPCDAITHAQAAAWGFRRDVYWTPLLATHLVAWGFLFIGGLFLPYASRWHASVNAGRPANAKWWSRWRLGTSRASYPASSVRTRLLNRNPYLWLTSRDRWLIPRIWIWLFLPPLAWGSLAWLSWTRGLNITVVLAAAAGTTWYIIFLATVPSHACRQIAADRLNGTLELTLCSPLSVREILRGLWLSVARHFLMPAITVMVLSTGIMIIGYKTSGFGGMLDPDDLGPWLFSWSAHMLLLPLFILAISWVALRRALFAADAGAASGIAFVQVVFTMWLSLWVLYEIAPHSSRTSIAARLFVAAVIILLGFTWHARRKFFKNLRPCSSPTYNLPASEAGHALPPQLYKLVSRLVH
jgi:hypothetical protein